MISATSCTSTSRPSPIAPVLDGLAQCATCGVEYANDALPAVCPICADERQYLPEDGRQRWADPTEFDGSVQLTPLEDGLYGLDVNGGVGIGQQAKLIVTEPGIVMVDVPAAISADVVAAVRSLGPMLGIIPSHPHMYGLQSAWSRALDGAPVWVTEPDRHWPGRIPESVHYWDELEEVTPGVTAAVLGGHFAGSAVVHWTGADGAGVLLCGDAIGPNATHHSPQSVTFLRSYPNQIPLSAQVVQRIAHDLERFSYDRLYGNFTDAVTSRADEVVQDSARLYAEWAGGDHDDLTGTGLSDRSTQPK